MWDKNDALTLIDKMCKDGKISPGMIKTIKSVCRKSQESIPGMSPRKYFLYEN